MVAVGINYGNFLGAVFVPYVFNHNRFNIYIAEPSGAVDDPHGMVPGRADKREGIINLFLHYLFGGCYGSSRGYKMRLRNNTLNVRHTYMYAVYILYSGKSGF